MCVTGAFRGWWQSCLTFKLKFAMNTTCTFDILHQRQSSVWIRRSWCWTQYIPQSWQSQACFLGSDCQLKNLLVIGPQKYWKASCGYSPDCQCAFDLRGVNSHSSCLLLFTAKASEWAYAIVHSTNPRWWSKLVVTIMWPITATHYSLSKLQTEKKTNWNATFTGLDSHTDNTVQITRKC